MSSHSSAIITSLSRNYFMAIRSVSNKTNGIKILKLGYNFTTYDKFTDTIRIEEFWSLAQYLGSNKCQVLSSCITYQFYISSRFHPFMTPTWRGELGSGGRKRTGVWGSPPCGHTETFHRKLEPTDII